MNHVGGLLVVDVVEGVSRIPTYHKKGLKWSMKSDIFTGEFRYTR
jgi:hypothetical protein